MRGVDGQGGPSISAGAVVAEPLGGTIAGKAGGVTVDVLRQRAHRGAKRALDIAVAAVLLLLMLPVMALVAVAIKVESPGPVLYRARRVGRRGAPFDMLKFRKMRDDAAGIPLTLSADKRCTRVGRFLTKVKLDELPQLLNVLRGEMSLVGPRPEDQSFVDLHAEQFARILASRPGVTGLSQLAFAAENEILDPDDPMGHYCRRILPQKLHLDELYTSTATAWLDLYILGWTCLAIGLRRPVAVHRTSGRIALRHRP